MRRKRSRSKHTASARTTTPKRPPTPLSEEAQLHAALAPLLAVALLRELAALDPDAVQQALLVDAPPDALTRLLNLIAVVLLPLPREQIRSADDVAALLMAEMSYLPQEQLRAIYLDTRSHVQAIETIYQGHLHGTTVPMWRCSAPPCATTAGR